MLSFEFGLEHFIALGLDDFDPAEVIKARCDVFVIEVVGPCLRSGEVGGIARAQQELGQPLVIIAALANLLALEEDRPGDAVDRA